MRTVARTILFKEGRFLLGLRDDSPRWELFGGRVESGETIVMGAHRELLEETSIDAKTFNVLDTSTRDNTTIYYVYFPIWSGEVKIGKEHDSFGWFTLKEIAALRLTKTTEYFFENLFGRHCQLFV